MGMKLWRTRLKNPKWEKTKNKTEQEIVLFRQFDKASAALFLLLLIPAATADDEAVMSALLTGLSTRPSGWSKTNPYCRWRGVTCDSSKRVTKINLDHMFLQGVLSPHLGRLSHLQVLYLRQNSLSGPFPFLAGLNRLRQVYLEGNAFDSVPPGFLDGLTSLEALGLSNNPKLPPWSLPNLNESSRLTFLFAANSSLTGPLGDMFGSLPELQYVDLSGNRLSGRIPSSIALLPRLLSVRLNDNNFSGPIPLFVAKPWSLDLSNNPLLWLGTPSSSIFRWQRILLGAAIGVVILLCLWLAHLATNECTTVDEKGAASTTIAANNLALPFPLLSTATNNFSQDRVLGQGGFGVVHKGVYPDGTIVAVKRMDLAGMGSRGRREFEAEIAALSTVRHRHLVELLGYCITKTHWLLVYEYMPRGTLSQHLFDFQASPLTWRHRFTIALDVARGVEYLHSLAKSSFIHRDLKPSNILIDDNMRAKVADFGFIKTVPSSSGYVRSLHFTGTFGYAAPECVEGSFTTKTDVYSFGVLLMEIIAGRKVLDESLPRDRYQLIDWYRTVHREKMPKEKEIDQSLKTDENTMESVASVFDLAILCTASVPKRRPDMGYVVNVLSTIVEKWSPTRQEEGVGKCSGLSLAERLNLWEQGEDTPSRPSASSYFSLSPVFSVRDGSPSAQTRSLKLGWKVVSIR